MLIRLFAFQYEKQIFARRDVWMSLLLKRFKTTEDKGRNKRYNFGQKMSVSHR